jgi:hypothetical protein
MNKVKANLGPGVREFLRQHQSEAALEWAYELARRSFPELEAINVRLLEDSDEDNHTWVVFHIVMPAAHPPELLQAQQNRYYEELARQNTTPYHPFSFSLMLEA